MSLYYYSKHTPGSFYHHIARDVSLRTFLLDTKLHELDNGQLRFIVGKSSDLFMNRRAFGKCDVEMLETACHHIDTRFCMAGVTERFDESMLLLRRSLGWSNCFYVRRNEGKKVRQSDQLTPDEVAQVKGRNQLDQLLYDHVVMRMDQRISALQSSGDDFASELSKFRILNASYNRLLKPPYDIYESCKLGAKWVLGYRGYHA